LSNLKHSWALPATTIESAQAKRIEICARTCFGIS
jgi:hypothetical protein